MYNRAKRSSGRVSDVSARGRPHMKTTEKQTAITRLKDQGKTVHEIAEALNVSAVTVYEMDRSVRATDRFHEAAEMYLQGLTVPEIAKQLGLSKQRVGKILGAMPSRTRRRTVTRTVRCDEDAWPAFLRMAGRLGLVVAKGGVRREGSPGRLIDAIGSGQIEVRWRPGYSASTLYRGDGTLLFDGGDD